MHLPAIMKVTMIMAMMTTEGSDLGSTLAFAMSFQCQVDLELLGCDFHLLSLLFCFYSLRDDTMSFTHTSVRVSELNYHINISRSQWRFARLHRYTLSKALAKPVYHQAPRSLTIMIIIPRLHLPSTLLFPYFKVTPKQVHILSGWSTVPPLHHIHD